MLAHRFTYSFLAVITALFWGVNTFPVQAGPQSMVMERFETNFRNKVGTFLNSLDAAQQKECLLPMNLKRRWRKQYTGSVRGGIQIKKLNARQKKQLKSTLKLVLSDYGWKMAETVAKQDGAQGLDKYYIACFGDPRKPDEPFAFRLCEHHLTIVHLEIKGGKITEFGPILLGANPPVLWKKDEALLMQAWQTQLKKNGSKQLLERGRGVAGRLMKGKKGIRFSALNADAQAIIKQAWEHRISIFTPVIQSRLRTLHKARGGWASSRVAYYNQAATQRSKDGGRWDFKCALHGMVWDFESSRGHIHMSLCVHPLKKK